ncbi:MAG: LamB/YcsF family protein, partial [Vicinamibacteria bacterium]|nr:LamB/YcsF family protein [Vicinamibacteria bacterium]
GDGRLAKRGTAGAVFDNPEAAAAQAVSIANAGRVTTRDGASLEVFAQTLCLHGDNPNALDIARAVRVALETAGVKVQALGPHGPA